MKILVAITAVLISFGCLASASPATSFFRDAKQLNRTNCFIEWSFLEGSGGYLYNQQSTNHSYLNMLAAPERDFSLTTFWAKAPGLTITDDWTNNPNGVQTATRLQANASSSLSMVQDQITYAATPYTFSFYVVGNAATNQLYRIYYKDAGAHLSADQTTSNAWQRVSYTFTPSATSGGEIGIYYSTNNTELDMSVWGLQLEAGSSATAYLPAEWNAILGNRTANVSTRPTWNASGYLGFQGSHYTWAQTGTPTTITNVTLIALVRWTGTPVVAGFASIFNDPYPSLGKMLLEGAFSSDGTPSLQFNGAYAQAKWTRLNDSAWHVFAATYDGTTAYTYLDETQTATLTSSKSAINFNSAFLSNVNSRYWPGDMAYILAYNRALSQSEIVQTTRALRSRLSPRGILPPDCGKWVAWEGDSITQGVSYSTAYPYLVINSSTNPVPQGWNFAVTGSTITNLNTRAPTVDASYRQTHTLNVLSVLDGHNDDLTTPSTFVAKLKTYCLARKATGWRVVVCTLLPSTIGGFNALRNSVNSLIAADPSFYDGICDFAADPTMGCDNCATNTTYYSDGTHPTTAGHALLAPINQAAIAAITQ